MTIAWRFTLSKKNVYCPIAHLSSNISAELQSVSGFNTMLMNNMYMLQKFSSVYRLSIVQDYVSKLDPKVRLNVKGDFLDEKKLIQESKEAREMYYLKRWYPPVTAPFTCPKLKVDKVVKFGNFSDEEYECNRVPSDVWCTLNGISESFTMKGPEVWKGIFSCNAKMSSIVPDGDDRL